MTDHFEYFKKFFQTHRRFVITTHINPDGDALGSEVAMAIYLSSFTRDVTIINQSNTPFNYQFLSNLFPIQQYVPAQHDQLIATADAILVLDTSSRNRFPDLDGAITGSTAVKICIDHHLEPDHFADHSLIESQATATGEILFDLFHYLSPSAINRQIAEALYVAIMTDTGSFRFPKTTARTYEIAAELVRKGADPVSLYQKVFEEGPVNRLRLLGRALDSLRTAHGGRIAYMILPSVVFDETGTAEADTDNMVNFTMTIGGVQIGLLFVQLGNEIKISLRSKGDIRINELAKQFGGNGHKHAAGARVRNLTLEECVKSVVDKGSSLINI